MDKTEYISRINKANEIYKQRVTYATNAFDERVELTNRLYVLKNCKYPVGSIIKIHNISTYIKVDEINVVYFPFDDSVEIFYYGLHYKKTNKGFVRTKSKKISRFAESKSVLIKKKFESAQ